MSKTRLTVSEGKLVWVKRKLWPRLSGWLWVYHRSDEDYLTKMKNELIKARGLVTLLQRRIPPEEDRIKEKIKALNAGSGEGPVQREYWWFRKRPVMLLENIKVGRKKKDREQLQRELDRAKRPEVLAQVVSGKGKA